MMLNTIITNSKHQLLSGEFKVTTVIKFDSTQEHNLSVLQARLLQIKTMTRTYKMYVENKKVFAFFIEADGSMTECHQGKAMSLLQVFNWLESLTPNLLKIDGNEYRDSNSKYYAIMNLSNGNHVVTII